ncbi:iron-containing alcohol dehydrogenase [Sulfurospirillum arcachonense]|uniref:iron-containing alcohol dehydrogenase n=1 Tax=Sulfurospirillum arcachonense TaxID=57666 RepID=UPI00046A3EF5|nr:iron-containing alcohol dehydrogenase [Sulfurospirillum arcachonense]
MNFSYYNPTTIQFGEGQIKSIVNFIDKKQKVLVVYGGGSIKKNGVYEQVSKALEDYTWLEFGGIEPNPTVETLNKAVKLAKEDKIDFVLAVGGGSVIDGCKYIVASALYQNDAWDFLDGSASVQKALPMGAILTLPATGSESNNGAVVSKKATGEKRFFHSNLVFPKFAVLDPTTMSTLSDRQIANGLVDAFVHTCEQYITYPNSSLVHDGYAETLLKGLVSLADSWDNRNNPIWQENLMWIANQALNGLIGTGVPQDWATHMIGHELTAFYGIDHARSLAVVQPQLLRIMQDEKQEKLSQMGTNVFGIKDDNEAVIKKIENIYESIGVSTNLNDHNIDDQVISNITNALKSHGMVKMGEKGSITLEAVSQILTQAMK